MFMELVIKVIKQAVKIQLTIGGSKRPKDMPVGCQEEAGLGVWGKTHLQTGLGVNTWLLTL